MTRKTALLAATALCAMPMGALAGPSGAQVVGGDATVRQTDSRTTVIDQRSQRAAIDFHGGLSTSAGERVIVNQPGASAIGLLRDRSGTATRFDGSLTADGHIWLVNANGVFIGRTAAIDVQGLIATTSDMDTDAFMGGSNHFNRPGRPDSVVINQGRITAREGGVVALVAPGVENSGVIRARLGKVSLAAGDSFTVDLYGDQLIEFAPAQDGLFRIASNSGTIAADGGRVTMTVDDARTVLDKTINMSGVIEARSVVEQNGEIVLLGSADSATIVSGRMDASGRGAGETGGRIKARGGHTVLTETAHVDASGAAGGGDIKIGGPRRGVGEGRRSHTTDVAAGARIHADAVETGDGGEAIVWSDGVTTFAGAITARGGAASGDGGFVEVSGKQRFDMTGFADVTATNGLKGELLLDPENIVITSADVDELGDVGGLNEAAAPVLWLNAQNAGQVRDTRNDGDIDRWYNDGSAGAGIRAARNERNQNGQSPDTSTGEINGRQAVYFDGDDVLGLNRSNAIRGATDERTTVALFQPGAQDTAGDGTARVILADGNGGRNSSAINLYLHDGQVSWGVHERARWDHGVATGTAGVAQDQTTLASLVVDGGLASGADRVQGFQDGAAMDNADTWDGRNPTTNPTLRNRANILIGSGHSGRNDTQLPAGSTPAGFDGLVGEVLTYNDALSDEARSLVEQTVAARWSHRLADHDVADVTLDESFISESYLEQLMETANVTLNATNNITIQSLSDNSLNIGDRRLRIEADADMDGAGAFRMDAAHSIRGGGGSLYVDAAQVELGTIDIGGAADITARNGDVTVNAATVGGAATLNARGGDVRINTADIAGRARIATQSGDVTLGDVEIGGAASIDARDGDIAIRRGETLRAGATTLRATGAITGDVDVRALRTTGASATLTGVVGGKGGAAAAGPATLIRGAGLGPHTINGVSYAPDISRLVQVALPASVGAEAMKGHGPTLTTAEAVIRDGDTEAVEIHMCEDSRTQTCQRAVADGERRFDGVAYGGDLGFDLNR